MSRHAASAFFPSPFPEAAILTVDGVGEWDTAAIGWGKGNRIKLLKTLHFPHSLGLLYSAFTYFCGFKVNSGEYKLMGLAPYGEPRYADLILEKLVDLKEDGSLAMDLSYFDYCAGLRMTGAKMEPLFGGPPRQPEAMITQREMDIAASIQKVTEEAVLAHGQDGSAAHGRADALPGRRRGPQLRRQWQAAAVGHLRGDFHSAGGGRCRRGGRRGPVCPAPVAGPPAREQRRRYDARRLAGAVVQQRGDSRGSWMGGAFATSLLPTRANCSQATAQAMVGGQVVGWFHGRMEFGPRALGARSIIGDARNEAMQATMNLRIKFRESFRPFAPCVWRKT